MSDPDERARLRRLLAALPEPLVAVVGAGLEVLAVGGQAAGVLAEEGTVGSLLPDVSDRLEAACRQALEGDTVRFEVPDTGLLVEVSPHLRSAGPVREVTVVVQDLSALREEQRLRRRSDDRYRDAFERAPVAMVHVDPDGRCMAANEAMAGLLGVPRAELEGRLLVELCHSDDIGRVSRAVASMVAGSMPWYRSEDRYVSNTGPVVWASVTAAPIRSAGGGVSHLLFHLVDITDQRRMDDQLRAMVEEDPLTRLKNRRFFEAALVAQAGLVSRYGGGGALLMLDIDHFKQTNDLLGHRAGDELLVSVAEVLRATLRTTDVVARIGGDEFAVILPQVTTQQAEQAADKVLRAIRLVAGVVVRGRRRSVTVSIGIAGFEPAGSSGPDLLMRADLAMYDAKEAGRDRYAVYPSAGDPSPTESRLAWIERVERDLADNRLTFVARPVADLRNAADTSRFELSLRMEGDDSGLVLPPMFLAAAGRAGLVERIDRWVIGAAMDFLQHPSCPDWLRVSINLSGATFGAREWQEWAEERLGRAPAAAGRLTLQIGESTAIADLPDTTTFAIRVAEVGCRISLDNFGAAFGSFAYLRHLPFDAVNIGGDIVRRCGGSDTDRLIVASIVDLAHGMGKEVLAEHVESEVVLDYLRREGVDYAQGSRIGEPFPAAQLLTGR